MEIHTAHLHTLKNYPTPNQTPTKFLFFPAMLFFFSLLGFLSYECCSYLYRRSAGSVCMSILSMERKEVWAAAAVCLGAWKCRGMFPRLFGTGAAAEEEEEGIGRRGRRIFQFRLKERPTAQDR